MAKMMSGVISRVMAVMAKPIILNIFLVSLLAFFLSDSAFADALSSSSSSSSSSYDPGSGKDPWAVFQLMISVGGEIWYVIKVALLISGVVGLVFIVLGLLKIRSHALDSQGSGGHLKHGIILIILGGLLFGTPTLMMLTGTSLFGSSAAPVTTDQSVFCQMVNGQYSAGCGLACPGNQVGGASGSCQACPQDTYASGGSCQSCDGAYGSSNYCQCPSGEVVSGGNCVATCPSGEVINGGTCAASCPSGEVINGGACAASCPSGEVVISGTCAANCPSGEFVSAGTCVANCPAGTVITDGACVACPSGDVINGGACAASCPSGDFVNSGVCVSTCPNGTGINAGSNTCSPCAAGQGTEGDDFSTGLAPGTCQPCPSEYGWGYVSGTPPGFCRMCMGGLGAIGGMCQVCPSNTFNYEPPSDGSVCFACPPYSRSGPGSRRCSCSGGGVFSISSDGVGTCSGNIELPLPGGCSFSGGSEFIPPTGVTCSGGRKQALPAGCDIEVEDRSTPIPAYGVFCTSQNPVWPS